MLPGTDDRCRALGSCANVAGNAVGKADTKFAGLGDDTDDGDLLRFVPEESGRSQQVEESYLVRGQTGVEQSGNLVAVEFHDGPWRAGTLYRVEQQ